MSHVEWPTAVGNDFVTPAPVRLQPVMPVPVPAPALPLLEPVIVNQPVSADNIQLDWRRNSFVLIALLFLLTSAGLIHLGKDYIAGRIIGSTASAAGISQPVQAADNSQLTVINSQLEVALKRLTSQPVTVTAGGKNSVVSAEIIRSWLHIKTDRQAAITRFSVNQAAINKYLSEVAAPQLKEPLNQVTITQSNGSARVIAGGREGVKLGDIAPLVQQTSDNLLNAKGLQLNLPLEPLPFAAVTPAAFDKLITVSLSGKHMSLYHKGELVKTYPISAGAPETPTVVGQFKIRSKLSKQTMRGFNANGTRYTQPDVRWINYFHKDYAIHGNYWRPSSWFGAINSSHGCVSLPDWQAKEVYDWAPAGTTVITYH